MYWMWSNLFPPRAQSRRSLSHFILHTPYVSCWAGLAWIHILTNQTHCFLCCCQPLCRSSAGTRKTNFSPYFPYFPCSVLYVGLKRSHCRGLPFAKFLCPPVIYVHMWLYNGVWKLEKGGLGLHLLELWSNGKCWTMNTLNTCDDSRTADFFSSPVSGSLSHCYIAHTSDEQLLAKHLSMQTKRIFAVFGNDGLIIALSQLRCHKTRIESVQK